MFIQRQRLKSILDVIGQVRIIEEILFCRSGLQMQSFEPWNAWYTFILIRLLSINIFDHGMRGIPNEPTVSNTPTTLISISSLVRFRFSSSSSYLGSDALGLFGKGLSRFAGR